MSQSLTNTNAKLAVSEHGRVILVDPNAVNTGPESQGNEMPPMEEMTAYVELYCIRRTDAVITLGGDGKYDVESLGSVMKVNMLNPDRVTEQNTTLWTNDLVGNNGRVNNEGFGIESIDITMGPNYNPLVSIMFRDIRGATLFEGGANSPLAVIFDFPPPIYKLKIKGAYGKFVEYDLHMVDHNSAQTDSNGDYTIKCNFVGAYFGPLTDMLIGYIKAAPFLRGEGKTVYTDDTQTSIVGGETTTINSFFELVNRGELLYAAVENYTNHSSELQETKTITTVNEQVDSVRKVMSSLCSLNNPEFTAYMKEKNHEAWVSRVMIKPVPGSVFTHTYSFQRDTLANPTGGVTPVRGSAIGGIPVLGSILGTSLVDQPVDTQLKDLILGFIDQTLATLQTNHGIIGPQTETRTQITYKSSDSVTLTVIDVPGQDFVCTIDYSALSDALDLILQRNIGTEKELKTSMESTLKKLADETLGLGPTIGNIFEVICKDYDYMMGAIRKAGIDPKPTTSNGAAVQYTVNGDKAWPYVQEKTRAIKGSPNGGVQTVLVYPGANPEFLQWPECQLVEKYCESLTEQQKAEQRYSNFKNAIDPSNYVPISPLEAIGGTTLPLTNPYMNNVSSLPQLYSMLLERYTITRDYSYGQIFDVAEDLPYQQNSSWFEDPSMIDQEQRTALVRMQAKLEAHNVAYVVQGTEEMTKALLNEANTTQAAVLEHIKTGPSAFLKTLGKKYDGFPFRGKSLFRRGSTSFNGIIAIVEKGVGPYQEMLTVKAADTTKPVDADRENLLKELSKTFFGGQNESRQAKINAGNVLIYPDAKAAKGSGQSDFFDVGTDLWIFNVKYLADGPTAKTYDFYQLLAHTALVEQKPAAFGSTYKRVEYSGSNAIVKERFFSRLDQYSVMVNLYDGLFGGDNDVVAKFLTPGVIEMPRIYALHLGYQLGKITSKVPIANAIGDAIMKALGVKRPKHKVEVDFMSQQDRERFRLMYQNFDMSEIITEVNAIWKTMETFDNISGLMKEKVKDKDFFTELSTKIKSLPSIIRLLDPVYVVNSSSMTFLRSSVIAEAKDGFVSLLNAESAITDPTFTTYLDAFHAELKSILTESVKAEQDAVADIQGKLQDPDFKANIYYNFKSLYDRWIVGTDGYKEGELYERFKFITRSHQNIAQSCIVDFHNLIEDSRNPDMSIFTSIGRLLQENSFQFYPLHSYMEYDGTGDKFDSWSRSWQIDNHLTSTNTSKPAFVCMYAGGYSSQVETTSNGSYADDGFTFQKNLPEDFNTGAGDGYLYAFVARVNAQNNSIFGFPEWSMEEFKATDVSLKMESKLLDKPTGSEKIRKSQNLMNIYQQRSYNVGMNIPMGNMCIQPTQYFQLEGMPFLNGAYMVHEVSHSISSSTNRLETKFKGFRSGRFIQRIITEYLLSYTGMSAEINNAVTDFDANPANNLPGGGGGSNSKKLTDGQILELCTAYGYEYNMIKAFIKVEAQGGGYDTLGRLKIQFEPKYFRRYTKQTIKNGVEGATAEWKAFNEASVIDAHAAKMSTSWGMGQIMGANHEAAGFLLKKGKTVEDMVTAFEQSEYNQLQGMLNFIRSDKRLDRAVKAKDFPNIAKYYNGAGYRVNSYDTKLAREYQYYLSRPLPQPNGKFNFAAGDQTFKVVRQTYSDESTIGGLTLNGEFICYILEDKVRPPGEPVVRGKTAIQAGLYPLDLTVSTRFKREMPEITQVPNQRGIRMHEGNTADDSLGCLIVGLRKGTDTINGSREAYDKLYGLMKAIKNKGDGRMFIQIQDSPHA